MNTTSDREYFAKRVTEELVKAATCEDNTVARVHLNMAWHYRRRVARPSHYETE